jgi:hypothetical protein
MRFLSVLIGVVVSVALAQEPPMFRGPGAERVEQFKKIRLMEVLKLDEETSLRFFARYNKHQEELRGIALKRDSLLDQLELYRRRTVSDAEYEKVFKSLVVLGHEAVKVREKFVTELKEVLNAKQIADYLVFERRFYENLRDIMREMQRERRGMMR